MKNLLRFTYLLIFGMVLSTTFTNAQQQQMPQQPAPLSPDEVTDEQLTLVSNVTKSAQDIQQEADKKMRKVVEEVGMEYTRFQQIMMAQQNPQMAGQIDISSDEQATLQQIQPDLMKVQQEAQQQYISKIEEQGLTVQKFQQIAQAIQAHPEVAKRFEAINSPDKNEEEKN